MTHDIQRKPLIQPNMCACQWLSLVLCISSPCYCPLSHGVETSFSRLLCHLLSASSSLDLCVFAFSNMDLCRAILALHKKGVVIRVLADKDYSAISGSQIGPLRKAGEENKAVLSSHIDNASVYQELQHIQAQ